MIQLIKSWNQDVYPRYGMTDYYVKDINATEEVFPGK